MATRGPEPMVTEQKLRRAIRRHEEPFVTSGEMADVLGVERQTAWKHLQRLHDNSELAKKKIGGSAVIWWFPKDCS